MNGHHGNGFFALGSALVAITLTLTGCEGGFGLSDAGKAQAKGEDPGLKTQAPEDQAPASTAIRPCEGFPGFDRGCPRGGK